jgi:hypothetical protein
LQTAQKSWARPVGIFCTGEGGAPADPSDASAEIANAAEMTLALPVDVAERQYELGGQRKKRQPGKTPPPFDRNHLMGRGPETDGASLPYRSAS